MHRHKLIRRGLTGALVIAAASVPSAAQATIFAVPGGDVSLSGAAHTTSAASRQAGADAQSGFQWADVGIGAAGTLVLVGAGASAAARRRRGQRLIVG